VQPSQQEIFGNIGCRQLVIPETGKKKEGTIPYIHVSCREDPS
jgi:hypothetical protein